jgi:hypothetical protein
LKPDGYLVLITQSAWLDVEYGIPVQLWMLQNFRIQAVFESEIEPWFTDARVATAVTVLRREPDSEARDQNPVRFIQFKQRLDTLIGLGPDETRLRAADVLRDELLQITADVETAAYCARVLPQSELEQEGRDAEDAYVGAKWGRYIRSTNCIYRLQRARRDAFVPMQQVATVRRGITTNCDDFFLVADVTDDALRRFTAEQDFRERFGASRRRVSGNTVAIVRRADGVEAALERTYLRPIMKTARDFRCFATSRIERADVAVVFPNRRTELSELADRYVRAGEREGWHHNPSFQNLRGRNWFSLRDAVVAPLLFVKTMQYTPVVLLNNGGFLANQRLYELQSSDDVETRAFAAVLNSTIFAAERYAGVKALGREAAIDVEVFTARKFRTPDIRRLSSARIRRLSELMNELCDRDAGPMLEEGLLDTTLGTAQRYIDSHPVTPDVWPAELRNRTRQSIDRIILEGIGVPRTDVDHVLTSLYTEMTVYTRKLKRLELEAQINRQGSGGEISNVRDLAQDLWAQLASEGFEPIPVPDGFFDRDTEVRPLQIPQGRAELLQAGLFDTEAGYGVRFGSSIVRFDSPAERDYCFTLANVGVRGETQIPVDTDECARLAVTINAYVQRVVRGLNQAVADLTSDSELQHRILREGMRRILQG